MSFHTILSATKISPANTDTDQSIRASRAWPGTGYYFPMRWFWLEGEIMRVALQGLLSMAVMLLMASAVLPSRANEIDQTFTASGTLDENNNVFSSSLFPQFNPALGTLTSMNVTVTVSADLTGTVDLSGRTVSLAGPHLSPAVLMLVSPQDEMVRANPSVARAMFDSIRGAKEWYPIAGGHFGLLYQPSEVFSEARAVQVGFLRRWADRATKSNGSPEFAHAENLRA
jgi:hypothetical protein